MLERCHSPYNEPKPGEGKINTKRRGASKQEASAWALRAAKIFFHSHSAPRFTLARPKWIKNLAKNFYFYVGKFFISFSEISPRCWRVEAGLIANCRRSPASIPPGDVETRGARRVHCRKSSRLMKLHSTPERDRSRAAEKFQFQRSHQRRVGGQILIE